MSGTAREWHVDELGTPITGVTTASAGYTADRSGRAIGIVTAVGEPAIASAVAIESGELLATREIDGNGVQVWEYVTTPDRRVHFGTTKTGEIITFDPDTLEFERVAERPYRQSHFFSATLAPDGEVLFGSYPDGRIIGYRPETDGWRDYGTIVSGTNYVRRMCVVGDEIYVGTGTPGRLVRAHRHSGEVAEIALPAKYAAAQFIDDVSVRDELLFVHPKPSSDLLVYSLKDQAWVDVLTEAAGLTVSPAITIGPKRRGQREVLIKRRGAEVTGYRLDTREQRCAFRIIGHPDNGDPQSSASAARGWGQLRLPATDDQGDSVVTAMSNGEFWSWSPRTGVLNSHRTGAAPAPFFIRSMATGPDGDIYVGGYASPRGLGRVDAVTGSATQLPASGQPEGLVAHESYLVFGTYTSAHVHWADLTQPWELGRNPGPPLVIGQQQDRPLAMASAGDLVAIGTMPYYGTLGGALSLFDPDSGALRVFRNVVPEQTVLSLTYADGMIYGGTSIWGGIGIEPSTSDAHLFQFDTATSQVAWSGVPVPGAANISALTFDDQGQLWGLTAGEIFRFDPASRSVSLIHTMFPVDDGAMYAKGRALIWRHDRLVGATAGRVFELDPATLTVTVVATGVHNLAIDRLDHYYFSRGSQLLRARLSKEMEYA